MRRALASAFTATWRDGLAKSSAARLVAGEAAAAAAPVRAEHSGSTCISGRGAFKAALSRTMWTDARCVASAVRRQPAAFHPRAQSRQRPRACRRPRNRGALAPAVPRRRADPILSARRPLPIAAASTPHPGLRAQVTRLWGGWIPSQPSPLSPVLNPPPRPSRSRLPRGYQHFQGRGPIIARSRVHYWLAGMGLVGGGCYVSSLEEVPYTHRWGAPGGPLACVEWAAAAARRGLGWCPAPTSWYLDLFHCMGRRWTATPRSSSAAGAAAARPMPHPQPHPTPKAPLHHVH
jgi:hypothetical protein